MQSSGISRALPFLTRMAWVGQARMQCIRPSALVLVDPEAVLELTHGPCSLIFAWTDVPLPTSDSIRNSSEFFFMLGRPMPNPKPISRISSEAVE